MIGIVNIKNITGMSLKKDKYVNPNIFIRKLSEHIKEKSAYVIDGGGTALYAGFQSLKIKKNTKVICSSSISSMGTGLAETIGAGASNKFKKLICIIGDGSFLNEQSRFANYFSKENECYNCFSQQQRLFSDKTHTKRIFK